MMTAVLLKRLIALQKSMLVFYILYMSRSRMVNRRWRRYGTQQMGELSLFSLVPLCQNELHRHLLFQGQKNSSFVDALKCVDGLVRVRKGYGVNTMHSDSLAAHIDINELEDIQDDLRIRLKATSPYLHCLNGYAKAYMRVLKVDTYARLLQAAGTPMGDARLLQAVGTPMGDDCITDGTDLWCVSMEQSKLTNNSESLATTKQVTDAYVNREQMFYEDTEILSTSTLQPFVTQCL